MTTNQIELSSIRINKGKHYFLLEGEALKEFKETIPQFEEQFKHTPKVYLWTERGAFLHAKKSG